jgi:hypothetical protein
MTTKNPEAMIAPAVAGHRCAAFVLAALGVVLGHPARAGDGVSAAVDGEWTFGLTCPNTEGALGFVIEFPVQVVDRHLHGERGSPGTAGWMSADGDIGSDGHALLLVRGIVGASAYAVGRVAAGTPYAFHVRAELGDQSGTGTRVEGRPCTVAFTKRVATT